MENFRNWAIPLWYPPNSQKGMQALLSKPTVPITKYYDGGNSIISWVGKPLTNKLSFCTVTPKVFSISVGCVTLIYGRILHLEL